jgi:tetratricopeptide (TPR) repeat protein
MKAILLRSTRAAMRRWFGFKGRRLALALVVGAATLAAGHWASQHGPRPAPISVDLSGAPPEVAELIETASAAVRRNRGSAQAWGRLGMALLANQFEFEARDCLTEAERLDPADPHWPYLSGCCLARETPEGALPLLEKGVAGFGDLPAPRLRLAEVLLSLGRLDEAATHFRQVLQRDEHDSRARLGFARVALVRGEPRTALEHATRATPSRWTRKAHQAVLLEINRQMSNLSEVEQSARRLAELPDDPDMPDPVYDEVKALSLGVDVELGAVERLYQSGARDVALKRLESAAREHPESYNVLIQLGKAHLLRGESRQAIDVLRRAVLHAPAVAEAHFQLGNACFLAGEYTEAASSFRRANELAPGHATVLFNLAVTLSRLDDVDGAIEAYTATLERKPNYVEAHLDLAALLIEQCGDAETALAHARQAVEIAPHDRKAKAMFERIVQEQSKE